MPSVRQPFFAKSAILLFEHKAYDDSSSTTLQAMPSRKGGNFMKELTHSDGKLPSFRGENAIECKPHSPTVLYVCWDIARSRMRMVASYLQADSVLIKKGIRLYDVTGRCFDGASVRNSRDIIVDQEASSWYIPDVVPGHTYIADFGLFHGERFCPILRSEPAAAPRSQPSAWSRPRGSRNLPAAGKQAATT